MPKIPGVKAVVAVSSGKGGVGKSTVSTNLAVSLSKLGLKVGLMDADVYGPNIPTMLGITEGPKLIREETPDGKTIEKFVPPEGHGLKVMSMGFLVEHDQPLIWRGPMLHSILTQFCNNVQWGELDVLVLDLPPGTGDVQLSLAQLLEMNGAVMVTTPQEIALQDVRKAFAMWEKVRVPVFGVVENMSYFKGDDGKIYSIFGDGGGESLAKKYGTEVLIKMPLVSAIRESGDLGRPMVIREPDSEAAKLFIELAKKVKAKLEKELSGGAGVEIGTF